MPSLYAYRHFCCGDWHLVMARRDLVKSAMKIRTSKKKQLSSTLAKMSSSPRTRYKMWNKKAKRFEYGSMPRRVKDPHGDIWSSAKKSKVPYKGIGYVTKRNERA